MKELTLELTTKCQLNCLWCSSYSDTLCELKLEDIINHLDLARNEDFSIVRFSGGEPTEHKDITTCIKYAKSIGFNIILLTNGINKYFNMAIDKYELQWNPSYIHIIKWYKNMCDNARVDMSINVVNIIEADIGSAINFAVWFEIPIHIMKLQNSGLAYTNKKILHEVYISMTGDLGCNRNNKKLVRPNGSVIFCAADKTGKEKCKYDTNNIQSK